MQAFFKSKMPTALFFEMFLHININVIIIAVGTFNNVNMDVTISTIGFWLQILLNADDPFLSPEHVFCTCSKNYC